MTVITQAQVNRGVDKETGEVFYTIHSDSTSDTYTIEWNDAGLCWECNCPAHTDSCKHTRAVVEVIRSKKSDCLDSRYDLPLHSSKGFSLLK